MKKIGMLVIAIAIAMSNTRSLSVDKFEYEEYNDPQKLDTCNWRKV